MASTRRSTGSSVRWNSEVFRYPRKPRDGWTTIACLAEDAAPPKYRRHTVSSGMRPFVRNMYARRLFGCAETPGATANTTSAASAQHRCIAVWLAMGLVEGWRREWRGVRGGGEA